MNAQFLAKLVGELAALGPVEINEAINITDKLMSDAMLTGNGTSYEKLSEIIGFTLTSEHPDMTRRFIKWMDLNGPIVKGE